MAGTRARTAAAATPAFPPGGDHSIYFATVKSLLPADRDREVDVYTRRNGRNYLISAGGPERSRSGAFLEGASTDGSTAFIQTGLFLLSADGDEGTNVYAWKDGRLRLCLRWRRGVGVPADQALHQLHRALFTRRPPVASACSSTPGSACSERTATSRETSNMRAGGSLPASSQTVHEPMARMPPRCLWREQPRISITHLLHHEGAPGRPGRRHGPGPLQREGWKRPAAGDAGRHRNHRADRRALHRARRRPRLRRKPLSGSRPPTSMTPSTCSTCRTTESRC